MSTDYSPGSSRRQRRGRRRRRGGEERTPAPPQKKSLWQKIASFFGGKPEERQRPAAASPQRTEPRNQAGRREERERPRAARPPVTLEVTSPRLYVGNLSFDATESDLFDLFSGAGSVVNVEVVCSRHNQRPKGFAFVQMQTVEEAQRAAAELHDKEYMGRKLLVSGAKALDTRDSERSVQPEQ